MRADTNTLQVTQESSNQAATAGDAGIWKLLDQEFGGNLESWQILIRKDSAYQSVFENYELPARYASIKLIEHDNYESMPEGCVPDESEFNYRFPDLDLILKLKFHQVAEIGSKEIGRDSGFGRKLHDSLINTLKESFRNQNILYNISQVTVGCVDMEQIFFAVVDELRHIVNIDRISLVTYHEHHEAFRVEAEYERTAKKCSFMKQFVRLNESDLGLLLERRQPLSMNVEEFGDGTISQQLARRGYQSFLLIPVYDKDRLLGSLNIGSFVRDPFTRITVNMLSNVAGLIGCSLKASGQYSELSNVIADYKEAQEHFLLNEKYRNFIDITRGVLHAFNNHLALIMGRAQLLRQFSGDVIDPEKAKKGLDIILRASTDASEQIAKLQSYARINNDEENDLVQIKGLIEEIVQLSMPRWKAMGHGAIEFKLNLDDQAHFVGSRRKLREAIINIMMNAVEASEESGGTVTVTAERLSDKSLITISDQGVGIPREQIPKLFIPFYSTKEGGTGLGLAVAYRIVREHGGKIDVKSTPGKGTTITLALPSNYASSTGDKSSDAQRSLDNAIVIQGSPINRRYLTRMLEQCGLQIRAGGSIKDMHELSLNFEPELVILDDGINEADPVEFLINLKKDKPGLFVCLICSHIDTSEQRRLEKIGIDAFIIKPYEQSQIRTIITSLRERLDPQEE